MRSEFFYKKQYKYPKQMANGDQRGRVSRSCWRVSKAQPLVAQLQGRCFGWLVNYNRGVEEGPHVKVENIIE